MIAGIGKPSGYAGRRPDVHDVIVEGFAGLGHRRGLTQGCPTPNIQLGPQRRNVLDDAPQNQMAMAALVAALVETLDETHVGFTRAFLRHLDEKRARLSDGGIEDRRMLEPLLRTRALLMEDIDRAEPASVVYAKDRPLEDQLPSSDKIQLPTLDAALQFWTRLPNFDREHATIETASGHRLDFAAISGLVKRQKERLQP